MSKLSPFHKNGPVFLHLIFYFLYSYIKEQLRVLVLFQVLVQENNKS